MTPKNERKVEYIATEQVTALDGTEYIIRAAIHRDQEKPGIAGSISIETIAGPLEPEPHE